jgi:hypothetical protein
MEIKPITKFRVDSCEFNTKEEAEEYIRSKTDKSYIANKNFELLNYYSSSLSFIPCIDDNDKSLRVFIKRFNNTDQGDGWEDLLGREHLRYVEYNLTVISSNDFVNKFIDESATYSIEAQDLGQLISALRYHIPMMNDTDCSPEIIYQDVLDALSMIQYEPVYIYD